MEVGGHLCPPERRIPVVPWIDEEDRRLWVSPNDADRLVDAGLVSRCECGDLHHEEYERWDDITALLQLAHQLDRFTNDCRFI